MTRPGKRPTSAAEQKLAASLSGAVDLSGLKKRAEARQDAGRRGARTPAGPGGPAGAASQGTGGAPAGGGAAPGPGAGAGSVDVDETSFEQEVLVRSTQVPVVTEFWSPRAPTAMTDTLSAMAEASGGAWVHARIDVDANLQLAEALQLRAVPTVLAMAGGRPIAEFEGEQPEEALRGWIEAVLRATEGKLAGPAGGAPAQDADGGAEPEDPERDAAEAALAEGDLATAEQAFAELAAARPDDHSLTEAWRHVQACRRVEDATDTGDTVVDEALRAADRAVLAGEHEQAFRALVDAVRLSAGDERARARGRLLELFGTLPVDDPRVLAARRDLASALY